ncbi:MAG: ModE family transcriptional regulator [Novosphingobium sp.]
MVEAPYLKIKIQLFCGDEIAMGPGKADLLEAISREGSISAAGRALGMSYRRTWLLVDTMNRCWAEPLVATNPGNARGGGACVTTLGKSVLTHFRSLQHRISNAASCPDRTALAEAMLAAPRTKGHAQLD